LIFTCFRHHYLVTATGLRLKVMQLAASRPDQAIEDLTRLRDGRVTGGGAILAP